MDEDDLYQVKVIRESLMKKVLFDPDNGLQQYLLRIFTSTQLKRFYSPYVHPISDDRVAVILNELIETLPQNVINYAKFRYCLKKIGRSDLIKAGSCFPPDENGEWEPEPLQLPAVKIKTSNIPAAKGGTSSTETGQENLNSNNQQQCGQINWAVKGLKVKLVNLAASSLCKIWHVNCSVASGFLFSVHIRTGDAPLLGLLTNNHVIPGNDLTSAAYCFLEFEFLKKQIRLDFNQCSYRQTQINYDATFIQLPEHILSELGEKAKYLQCSDDFIAAGSHAFIAHHPAGDSRAEVTPGIITNTTALDLHYNFDTLEGSSGSPVLNLDGQVIGLHKAAYKTATERYNIATRVALIHEWIRNDYGVYTSFYVDPLRSNVIDIEMQDDPSTGFSGGAQSAAFHGATQPRGFQGGSQPTGFHGVVQSGGLTWFPGGVHSTRSQGVELQSAGCHVGAQSFESQGPVPPGAGSHGGPTAAEQQGVVPKKTAAKPDPESHYQLTTLNDELRAQLKLMMLSDVFVQTILVQWWKLIDDNGLDVNSILADLETMKVIDAKEKEELAEKKTEFERVNCFLTMLLRKSMLDYINMLDVVRRKQPPVAEILSSLKKRKPSKDDGDMMTSYHVDKITINLSQLVDNMSATNILPFLVPGVFIKRDSDVIMSKSVESKRADCLLQMLRKRPDSAYRKFVDSLLKTGQSNLAKLLDASATEPASEVDSVNVVCPVCTKHSPSVLLIRCGHTLCTDCLAELRQRAKAKGQELIQCPLCAQDVLAYQMS